MYTTTTNDPTILSLVAKHKLVIAAWEAARKEQEEAFKNPHVDHMAAMKKVEDAWERVNTVQTGLCAALVWALDHNGESQ